MFNQTQLSIVIPTYNSANTIGDCLESIAQVRGVSLDVIFIDNLSADHTLQIINRYIDILPFRIISEKDNGVSDAFNKGILMAKTRYILLLGSDDVVIPHSLEYVCNNYLTDCMSLDILFTGIVDMSNDNQFFTDIASIKINNSFVHPGTIISKDAYDKFGLYNLDYRVGMDYEFLVRALTRGASYANIMIPTVRHSSGGISSNKIYAFHDSFLVRKKYFKSLLPLTEIFHYLPHIIFSFIRSLIRYV